MCAYTTTGTLKAVKVKAKNSQTTQSRTRNKHHKHTYTHIYKTVNESFGQPDVVKKISQGGDLQRPTRKAGAGDVTEVCYEAGESVIKMTWM